MEINVNEIPEDLFNWIREKELSELSDLELKIVDGSIGREEYQSLWEAHRHLTQPPTGFTSPRKAAIKADLLERFDKKHSAPVIPIQRKPIAIWKAAAAIAFLIGLGWTGASLLNSSENKELVAVADTIFIDREVPAQTVVLHDTVFVEKQKPVHPSKQNHGYTKETTRSISQVSRSDYYQNAGFDPSQVVSVSEINTVPNSQKGHTMKDDSLWRKLTIVSL